MVRDIKKVARRVRGDRVRERACWNGGTERRQSAGGWINRETRDAVVVRDPSKLRRVDGWACATADGNGTSPAACSHASGRCEYAGSGIDGEERYFVGEFCRDVQEFSGRIDGEPGGFCSRGERGTWHLRECAGGGIYRVGGDIVRTTVCGEGEFAGRIHGEVKGLHACREGGAL